MKTIDVTQKSQEWLDIRNQHFCASDAAAALGLSKFKTRTELLREKSTGISPEVDASKQFLFDRGHASEEVARPLVESYLQEDLSPVTGVAVIDGLPLLASFDGLNFEGTVVWENKLWSASLEAMIESAEFTDNYWPQLEQQLLVSGAERVLFTGCDGEKIKGQLWYTSRPERRAQLIAGWKQFAADLANYVHVEAAPVAVAAPINELPALLIEVSGSVVSSNLVQWQAVVKDRIASINTNLQTDNDFADAKQMVKFLDDGEKRIALVKSQAQAQAISIDEAFRALDSISATMRQKRLELDKLVKLREDSIKVEIVNESANLFAEHIIALSARIGMAIPTVRPEFSAAIKGKRTITSMRDAVATTLANAKIEASAIADLIQANLKTLDDLNADKNLFRDIATIATNAPDDFLLLAKSRIAEHDAKMAASLEAERQRIRAEEVAKMEREAAARAGLQATIDAAPKPLPESLPPSVNAVLTQAGDGLPKVAAAVTNQVTPWRYPLFEHMSIEYALTLTDSELDEIISICHSLIVERKAA